MTDQTTETARALLYRHGLPEDVIDGVLALHAQELAAVQRREAAVWGVDTAAGKRILAAADLIDPAKGPAPAVERPPVDRAALRERVAALFRHPPGVERLGDATPGEIADAVLAALPEPAARAAEWRAAADLVEAMNEGCSLPRPCTSCAAREDAADGLRDAARRMADEASTDRAAEDVTPPPALTEQGRLRAQVEVLQQDAERDRGLAKVGARCMRVGHQGLIESGRVVIEGHRFALSIALGLGTGAPWEAIHERVKQLAADRAAVLREAAHEAEAENAQCNAVGPCQQCSARTTVAIRLRRMADEAEPATPDLDHAARARLERLARAFEVSGNEFIADQIRTALNGPAGSRRADEAQQSERVAHRPARGDQFERWLKAQRDACFGHASSWAAVDGLLDQYRLHADTGTPLGEHVCEGRGAGARQDGAQR